MTFLSYNASLNKTTLSNSNNGVLSDFMLIRGSYEINESVSSLLS